MAYQDIIAAAAAKHRLDPKLLAAVIQHESGGNADAVGDGGNAVGLMQMHAAAAADVGVNWAQLRGNPALQVDAGAAYLAKMLSIFGGNQAWALGAYNQGPTLMLRARDYASAVLVLALVPPDA